MAPVSPANSYVPDPLSSLSASISVTAEAVDFFSGLSMSMSANIQAAVGEVCLSSRSCFRPGWAGYRDPTRLFAPDATSVPLCVHATVCGSSSVVCVRLGDASILASDSSLHDSGWQVGRHAEGTLRLDLNSGILFNSAYKYNKSTGVFAGAGLQARGTPGSLGAIPLAGSVKPGCRVMSTLSAS